MIHVKAMCIISHNGKVLATKGFDPVDNVEFFRLLGGGMDFSEKSLDTLKREMREELETEIENINFLTVIENVFRYQGLPGHEIIFLYSADLVKKELYGREEIAIADHPSVRAVWIPNQDVISGVARLFPTTDYATYLK